MQSMPPREPLSLDSVAVKGVERSWILPDGTPTVGEFKVSVALGADQRGAHMSRLVGAIDVVLGKENGQPQSTTSMWPWELAREISRIARENSGATQSAVEVSARWSVDGGVHPCTLRGKAVDVVGREANSSGESGGLGDPAAASASAAAAASANASATAPGASITAGVEITGITACPCAQAMVAGEARARLAAAGYSPEEAGEIVSLMPCPTHNQRARARLSITSADTATPFDAAGLAAIARSAMSAETTSMLKRPAERDVVMAAHANPVFVEDAVRRMLAIAATTSLAVDDARVREDEAAAAAAGVGGDGVTDAANAVEGVVADDVATATEEGPAVVGGPATESAIATKDAAATECAAAPRRLSDSDWIWAQQASFESIHAHDAVVEHAALVGDIRAELAG